MLIAFFVIYYCNFLFLFSQFVMPLSYGRHWEAMCVEGNENEEMLILGSILLLFLPLFLELYNFDDTSMF